ncbi:hypothetical protein BN946_scf184982.g18 [Trametes cinnabarina]|uniref:Uncharacterized protein n=1 Tax=Pycnoporus cinnabarinus TaxID=5643 RepID=A0A060SWE2_PYCCI|nr:hypothetical protein BN946_scf184982.g18 [Trametes cinnabarina]
MFTRVFTRTLLFRRGSEGGAKQRKTGSSPSPSRAGSPDTLDTTATGVLQPTQADAPSEDSNGLVSKPSLQSLGSRDMVNDENYPLQGGPERSSRSGKQGLSVEDPPEDYGIPHLGTNVNSLQASLTFASLSSDVETELPADHSLEHHEGSHIAQGDATGSIPGSSEDEVLSLSSSQTSYGLPYPSLHTGLLSDITEAEEPGNYEASPGPSAAALAPSDATSAVDKAALSFSSFGSSYTGTQSAETSMVLESESASSLSTHIEEAVRGITADAFAVLANQEDDQAVQLHPTLLASWPTQATRESAVATEFSLTPTPSECASQTDNAPSVATRPKEDAAIVESTIDIPAPTTYADAMNLALKYPEMSSKILNEPLASTCSSACPTPARSVSPAPSQAPQACVNLSGRDAIRQGEKRSGPPHTAECPNWALAPAEPNPARQSRPRGRGGQAGTRGGRGRRRSNWASRTSETPAPPSARTKHRLPSKPDALEESPEKRLEEHLSAREFRKETAENWRDRVSSWREQASESSGQTTPDVRSAPTSSVGVSPGMPLVAIVGGKAPLVDPHSEPAKSMLNPRAPVWEYKPPRRERAATDSNPQFAAVLPSVPVSTPIASVPRDHSTQDKKPDLERLRAMLHECVVEDKRSSMQLAAVQAPGPSNPSGGPSFTLRPVMSFANFGRPPALSQTFEMARPSLGVSSEFVPRQRTQTNHSLAHRASWQGEGIQARLFPSAPSRDLANPAIWRQGKPSAGVQLQPSAAQSQYQERNLGMDSERLVKPLPSGSSPIQSNNYSGFPSVPQASGSSAVMPSSSNAQPSFNFARAGMHPGPAAQVSALLPPGSERTRPSSSSFSGGTVPPQKRARFYGIETPRVVFDKSGWTVNDRP